MKIFLLLCSLFVTTTSVASAPNFQVDNNTSLASLKGQVVYVDFWASWCKPCRASFPWMNKMHKKYAEQGLVVIAINLDEDAHNAEKFLAAVPAPFPIVYDPEGSIAQQYELVGMPSSYIIDKAGEIRVSHQGFFTAKASNYENEIKQLLAE